jgi:Family of unknown function (DUF6355)
MVFVSGRHEVSLDNREVAVRTRVKNALLATVAMAGLLTVTGPATAAQAGDTSPTPAQFPCGFYERDGQAFYGHCDQPPPTWVIINVDVFDWVGDDYTMCVPPGVTHLGSAFEVVGAWYIGRICG